MWTHRRIHKSKPLSGRASGSTLTEPEGPAAPSGRMAVPMFRGRVAPVLDTCTCILVMDMNKAPPVRRQVSVSAQSIPDRVQELLRLGIGVIICGALSDRYCRCLKENAIHLICGIAGDIDAVISAYREGTLARDCFRMPGAAAIQPHGEQNAP